MVTKYIESEKLWRSEKLNINFSSLGQAILDKLAECCATNPNRVLEIYHENGLQLTVSDVRCQTITVARNLLKIGVKEGDTVVLFSKANAKISSITFACYIVGAAVSFVDITSKDDVINYAFDQINPTIIIFEDVFKSKVLTAIECVQPPKLKYVLSLSNSSINEILFKFNNDDIEDFQPPKLSDPFKLPAILAFTSGSTGMPKLAIHSHAMMLQGLFNGWWQLSPGSVVCILCDQRWICQIEMMLQPLFFDVKRVLSLKSEKELNGALEAEIIHEQKVTHYSVVPMIFLDLLSRAEEFLNDPYLDSLKLVILVGEVITEATISRGKRFLPHCRIIKCYGMTELPGMVATDELVDQTNSNGMALKDGFFTKIIDEHGNSLGPNEKGRLLFKSQVPILGYLKNKNGNKLAFAEDGWFDTQDYALMDCNNLLKIVTRSKFLIHSAGRTIVPSDVENIVNNHESVVMCALIGHPNVDSLNDELGTIFVVLKNKNMYAFNEIENELKKLLKTKLTNDQLEIVRFIKFLPDMPLTNCSKINRKKLRTIAEDISSTYLIK